MKDKKKIDEKIDEQTELTTNDLAKALDEIEAITKSSTPEDRLQELATKLQKGEINDEERQEMYKLMDPTPKEKEPDLSKSIDDQFNSDDYSELQKGLDVSDFLSDEHDAIKKSLSMVANRVEASDARTSTVTTVLCKAVAEVGKAIIKMQETLDAIAGQPARAPKSKGTTAEPLDKSFAGQNADAGNELTKSQVLDKIEEMYQKSIDAGQGGYTDYGVNLLEQINIIERTGSIDPRLLAKIKSQ